MVHLVAGLVLVVLGISGIVAWWNMFGLVMRGGIPFLLLVLGFLGILSALRRSSRQSVSQSRVELEPVEEEEDLIASARERAQKRRARPSGAVFDGRRRQSV